MPDPGPAPWRGAGRSAAKGRKAVLVICDFQNPSGLHFFDRVGSIAVETHDRFMPGSHTRVMSAAGHFQDVYNSGATWFMLREKTPRPEVPAARRGYIMS